jgi:site-specific DNA recombinase
MSKPIAIGYVRVSSIGQATEGVSLDVQREKLKAWAELNGYSLAEIETDGGKSGGKMSNRPGLQRAIDAACRHGCPLVVYSLSRLARSSAHATGILERLRSAGADFVSLSERIDTTSAAGRMFFAMLAAFAAFEREVGGERTAIALRHLKASGKRYSRLLPFGYCLGADGETLEAEPQEQRALLRIKGLSTKGYSLRRIEAALGDEGLTRADGSPIALGVIRRAVA